MAHRTPDWQVIAVFDPDRNGHDFAYTFGLARHGRPELHVWARPTHGSDPGADWKFSPRDLTILLNQFAFALLDDDVAPGDERTEQFDDGTTTVTFTVGDAVPPKSVEAHQLPAHVPVLPVRWTLDRVPEGALGPVAHGQVEAVRTRVARLRATHGDSRTNLDLDPAQGFGPLTPLVVAYAATLTAADAHQLVRLCENSLAASTAGAESRHVLALTAAAARPSGRTKALAAVRDHADTVMTELTSGPAWPEAVDTLGGNTGDPQDPYLHALTDLVSYAVTVVLTTAAVLDVADPALVRAGLGPWEWALSPDTTPPGWEADRDQLQHLADAVAELSPSGLGDLVSAWERFRDDEVSYETLSAARGHVIAHGGGLPDLDLILGTDGVSELEATQGPQARDSLQAALTFLLAAGQSPALTQVQQRAVLDLFGGLVGSLHEKLTPPRG